MPCDVCGRTVQKVAGCADTQRTFWCPTCGSVIEDTVDFRRVESPSVVKGLKDLQNKGIHKPGDGIVVFRASDWNSIAEAVGMEKVT